MPDLHDVVVTSPVSFHKYVEAIHAELDEARGTLTLVRDVVIWNAPVTGEEYAVTSRTSGQTLRASYVGVDPTKPGGLVFLAISQRQIRPRRRPRTP